MEVGVDFLDVEVGSLPVEFQVVSTVGTELDYDFGFNVFVVGDGEVETCAVASVGVGLVLGCDFVSSNVEGVSSGQSDILVLGSVVDAVLANELQRSIAFVSLEHPHDSLRQRNTQTVGLLVSELYLVGSLDVALRRATRSNGNKVVFPDIDVVDLRNELHLLLGVIVQRNRLAQGVHVEI